MTRLNTSNIHFDADGTARDQETDEVLFDYAFEAQEAVEPSEPKAQKRLASTCLPKAARAQMGGEPTDTPCVVKSRISEKLIAASVAQAKAAAARR